MKPRRGCPVLYTTAFGGGLLGLITGIVLAFRAARLAFWSGVVLTTLFLLLFLGEGYSDSHWIWAMNRDAPLIAWAFALLVLSRVYPKPGVAGKTQQAGEHQIAKSADTTEVQ